MRESNDTGSKQRLTREGFVKKSAYAGIAVAAGVGALPAAARITRLNRKLDKRTIIVGRQPGDPGSSAYTRYLINHPGILRAEAAKVGYDLDVQWRDYPGAPPIMQLYQAGSQNMSFAVIGTTPATTVVSRKLPIQFLGTSGGAMPFYLLVPPNSDIKSVEDLRGKTVGTVVGADPQNAFIQTIRATLGVSPDELGIKFVNFPTLPLAASLPGGIDAAGMIPAIFAYQALNNNQARVLVDTLGRTGVASALGPGKILPSVNKSPYAPEGFYEHRGLWTCHEDIISKDPQLAQAFVTALQKGLSALKKSSAGKAIPVARLMMSEWNLPLGFATRILVGDIVWSRGWIWSVEGDFVLNVAGSDALVKAGSLSAPVTWQDLKSYLRPVAQIQQRGWAASNRVPPLNAFPGDKKLRYLRGYPVWQMSKWGLYANRRVAS